MRIASLAVFCLALAVSSEPALAQQDEKDVMDVVHGLFEAMSRADSSAVRVLVHPETQLITTGAGPDGTEIRMLPIERFIVAVGAADGWRERIWDWEVRIDDNLATVWTKYDFLLRGDFSHCGVDSFQLARSAEGWKIVSIADTRRTEGCETPPEDG